MAKSAYKRILLKLSGEALGGATGFGIDVDDAESIVQYAGKVPHETTESAYRLNVRIAHFKRFLHLVCRVLTSRAKGSATRRCAIRRSNLSNPILGRDSSRLRLMGKRQCSSGLRTDA
jgi:hypothetical protein